MSHLWLAITLTYINWFGNFGKTVTEQVSNQKMLYFPTSHD